MKTLITRAGCTLVLLMMVQVAGAADEQAAAIDEHAAAAPGINRPSRVATSSTSW